nr:hypothetical protein [Allomuricauda sp.]
MKSRMRVFLIVLATTVGGLSLVLYTTLSEEVILKGISYCASSISKLTYSGITFFVSAFLAGFLASLIVVRDNGWPHFFITTMIVGKMLFLLFFGYWAASFWAVTGLHFSLVAGLWAGFYGAAKFPLAPM